MYTLKIAQPTVSTTTKGKTLVIFYGFQYRVASQYKLSVYLQCLSALCGGRASCNPEFKCVKLTKAHTCERALRAEALFKRTDPVAASSPGPIVWL